MPRIIVVTDRPTDIVMLSERITIADLASEHFRARLLERLSWAVGDADAAEQDHREERGPAAPAHGDPATNLAELSMLRPSS